MKNEEIFLNDRNLWENKKGELVGGVDEDLEKVLGQIFYFQVTDSRTEEKQWLSDWDSEGNEIRKGHHNLDDAIEEWNFLKKTLPPFLKLDIISEETIAVDKPYEEFDVTTDESSQETLEKLVEEITSSEEQ